MLAQASAALWRGADYPGKYSSRRPSCAAVVSSGVISTSLMAMFMISSI